MANLNTSLVDFDTNFKTMNYKEQFDLRSSLFLAYYKEYKHCPKDGEMRYLAEGYEDFMSQLVQGVKEANQTKVNILKVDLKKYKTHPASYNLRVIAQALYRFYGIELKQVDTPSRPNEMLLSWDRDNQIFDTSFHQFQEFRQRGFLVDYQVKCRENSFPAHKVVLAARSNYFQSLFERSQAPQEHQIPFQDVKVASAAAWLDYLYTGDAKMTRESVCDLIQLAQYYGLGHLQKRCCDYLCKTVNVDNLVDLIGYAKGYELNGLEGALVASVKKEIALENLEKCLSLIRDYEIDGLETVCMSQIKDNFTISYLDLDKTQELLEIADAFSNQEIKTICNNKFERHGMNKPVFGDVMKWFSLACKHDLTNVSEYCTRVIPGLLEESRDILNDTKQLLRLAAEYNLAPMKELCTNLLMEKIETDRDKVAVLANQFNLERLKQAMQNS